MKMGKILLKVENIAKQFDHVSVLSGINIGIPEGSITAIVGPNGAGKTTLFHLVTGDLRPDGGEIYFKDNIITRLPSWKIARIGIGKLFQDVRIFEKLSVLDNVLSALYNTHEQSVFFPFFACRSLKKKQYQQIAKEHLIRAGVEGNFNGPAGELSYGNQKLLAITRLMAGKFSLMLLDEPTSGLSSGMIDRMGCIIKKLAREEGISIMLIEHNYRFVKEVADQVFVLQEGTIKASGDPAGVLENPEIREILIGS